MSRKITVDEAREFFAHPSQVRAAGITPDKLRKDGMEYWADGPVCFCTHPSHFFGLLAIHIAVKPEGWGRIDRHVLSLCRHIWAEREPDALVALFDKENRAVAALLRRIKARRVGEVGLAEFWEWTPWPVEQQ